MDEVAERRDEPSAVSNSRAEGYVRADAPIERRSEDKLRRAPLAEAIADQVIHGPKGQGLVIGIVGNWGSGKTSVLRMVEEAVRERSDTVVLRFNPWLFSSADQLVVRFLDELGVQLRSAGKQAGASDRLLKAGERLGTYAESLEPLGWVPLIGPWLSRIGGAGRVMKAMRQARAAQASAEEQRELVGQELRALDNRVLVIVDDLDRIESSQIRDMVRLIKLVGDFPNVTYLLSYDRGPVERALGETPAEGQEYLEKVIQVVHDLPEPPSEAVLRILLAELQEIVDTVPHGPFHPEDWQNVLPAGIRPFFATLRDVRRYLNAIPVSLRVIGQEVALVDALGLEAIRVFVPSAYAELAESVATLTGEGRSTMGNTQARDQADEARVASIVTSAGDHAPPTKEILNRLFPNIGHLVGGSRILGSEQEARQKLRVADPGVLRTYLRRSLPEGAISGALVEEAVSSLTDSDRLTEVFRNLDPETAEGLIQRLEDFEHDYEPEAVEPALPVLLNQLPRLREGADGMMDFGADLVVGRVTLRLLRRIEEEDERLAIVNRVLPRIDQLSGRMELIDTVGHRENVGHRLVTEDASAELYAELIEAVQSAPLSKLATERQLAQLGVRVIQADRDSGLAWLRDVWHDDTVLLQMFRSALSQQRAQTMGDYALRTKPSLPWEVFEDWFGSDDLKRRVAELGTRVDRDALPDRTRAALEAAEKYASGELTNRDFREGWVDEE